MIPVQGISELVLEVRDLPRAEQFYGEVMGWPLKRIEPRVTWVEAPRCRLQLRLYGTPGHRGAGPCHFAFAVEPEQIAPITDILKTHGVWARGPLDFGESTSVFCFDPDGNEIEFNDFHARQARQTAASGDKVTR